MAEAHPVGFRWVMKAKERGATIIHVDPRFSRTSALADIWVPIRAGGDIAFLGGLIRHIIENNLFFRDYVVHFTNASCIIREGFRDTEEGATGFFSGWNEQQRAYDKESWLYQGDGLSFPARDPTLQHPRCVFQMLRHHFSRYTPEMVEKICGISPKLFQRVADALVSASGPDKTAAICYAVGWTQQSKGVQIIRSASILQLLLGNIGRPGGGILALRGHASIQGSTDVPTLYDILPGYLRWQRGYGTQATLRDYLATQTKSTRRWHNTPAYFISLLKAYYGKNATAENDFGYDWVPKITANHSFFEYLYDMADGKMEGMFIMGQNPAVAAPNSRFERTALSKLKWLVIRDMVEIESASFWADSPEVDRGELKTEDIETEVFFFPSAGHAENDGTFTNTQRLLQWRQTAVKPPGDCRSDEWFMHQLAVRLIAKAKASNDPMDEPLRALDWWYPEDETGTPHTEAVRAEINGWHSDPATVVGGDKAQSKWTGGDVPDFPVGKSPDYRPTRQEKGLDAIPGDAPFMLHEDGLGWIYVPKGLHDGPFPTHYEPLESPVRNLLYSRDTDPVVNWFTRQENRFAPPGDPRFPYVLTTYRLTEHHTAGGMSRFLSHLSELQPEMFAEISPELARELKIKNADYICIVSLRAAIEARALVSRRIRPLQLNGKTLHQVAVPYHFGTSGLVHGSAANDLLTISGEPN